ncbi:MAG: hypothetical protein CME60_10370 [Halobacteriovoraceae bacterium]|nr:hypothetical protein [Halobacteriovoraceae bacterium]
MSSFEDFLFIEDIERFIDEAGLKKPTEVQTKVIPEIFKGENVSVLAQTGSGKTLSYALPIFQLLKMNDDDIPMELQVGAPRAIILTPTRELNQQVNKVLKSIAHQAKLRIRTLTGGDKGKISRRIADEAYDILVSSPSRLKSALERGEVKSTLLEIMIFDEADQLLDMGFTKDIVRIHELIKKEYRQMPVQIGHFSATWPAQYKNFLAEVFPEYPFKEIVCQGGVQLKRNIETYNIPMGMRDKPVMLESFLEKEGKGTGVVFLNRKEEAVKVFNVLKQKFPRRKLNILHGALSQKERREAFAQFRTTGGILVATDIAARGLDVKGLSWVLNYDLPFEAVYYVHRCGRTGREGKLGRVFNFVTSADLKLMARINEAILSQSSLSLTTLEPSGMKIPNQNKSGSKNYANKNTNKHTKKSGQSGSQKKAKKVTKKKASAAGKKTPRYKKTKKLRKSNR